MVARGWRGAVFLTLAVVAAALACAGPAGATTTVSSFPIPGATVAPPKTQIVFRGALVTPLSVVGSESGGHAGVVLRDTDGGGTSFIPNRPFAAGETVTVTTPSTIRVTGSARHRFHFTVAVPGPPGKCTPHAVTHPLPGEIRTFTLGPTCARRAYAF